MKHFPNQIGWDNWGSLMCDVELFTPLIREVCARPNIEYTYIQAGFPGTHAVFCLDEHYVVKFYAPLGMRDEQTERLCYRMISQAHIPLAPTFFGEGVVRAGGYAWPYIIIEYLPGTAAREVWQRLSPEKRLTIGKELGTWAVRYHALPDPFDASSPLSAQGWRSGYMDKLNTTLERMADMGFSTRLIEALRAFAMQQLHAKNREIMLIHCDLTEDHLLLYGNRMFLIDFADSRMAFECVEWAPLWFGLMQRDVHAFYAFYRACGHMGADELGKELLLGTLLHPFGAPILQSVIGDQIPSIEALAELLKWFP